MTGKSICIGRRLSSHHITGSLGAWIDEVSFTWLSLSSHRSSGPCICETLGLRRSGKVFIAKDIPPIFSTVVRLGWLQIGFWGVGYLELDFNTSELQSQNLHFYSLQCCESCLLVTPRFSAFLIRCVNDSFFSPRPFFAAPIFPKI